MFDEFRRCVKKKLHEKKITYRQLAEQAHISESAVKCFMSGASNSRRIAEKIADVAKLSLVYRRGIYSASVDSEYEIMKEAKNEKAHRVDGEARKRLSALSDSNILDTAFDLADHHHHRGAHGDGNNTVM